MFDHFIRTAAATPKIRVADPQYNREQICAQIDEACGRGVKLMVFPELCLTGYTCNDLFLQSMLIDRAKEELEELIGYSRDRELLFAVGLPFEYHNRLYNAAAFVCGGRLLGLVTKTNIPTYSEFYEGRHFCAGPKEPVWIDWQYRDGSVDRVPFGSQILFSCRDLPELTIASEICEDVWVPNPPSIGHAMAGATVIFNLSASDETTGKRTYRRNLVNGQSARLVCGYLYASAGEGESTQDLVYSGHNLICENGTLLAESGALGSGIVYADLDLDRLRSERRRMGTFSLAAQTPGYAEISFRLKLEELKLERFVDPAPFVPHDAGDRAIRCEEILNIQAMGLAKRLEHIGCRHTVVGLSGGLDSTLALLVMAKAYDHLGYERRGIHAVTMPCFGTTDRTYRNACTLAERIGAKLTEVNIREAVSLHFRDIAHDPSVHDVTYENSQARERTQVLMDLANQDGGIVIGTGDLSELALGWATYNGDHMSMYAVNCSVPKTLVRHLVRYYADTCHDEQLSLVLYDVLDTPVSPELLPPKDGVIAQKTEDIVGPYELHDFFLYYLQRFGYPPRKIFRLAKAAFEGVYGDEVILKWLDTFCRRYFAQQFKRSCLPDGPKVGSVAVSPRGDLRMPSDASRRLWEEQVLELKKEAGC